MGLTGIGLLGLEIEMEFELLGLEIEMELTESELIEFEFEMDLIRSELLGSEFIKQTTRLDDEVNATRGVSSLHQ